MIIGETLVWKCTVGLCVCGGGGGEGAVGRGESLAVGPGLRSWIWGYPGGLVG